MYSPSVMVLVQNLHYTLYTHNNTSLFVHRHHYCFILPITSIIIIIITNNMLHNLWENHKNLIRVVNVLQRPQKEHKKNGNQQQSLLSLRNKKKISNKQQNKHSDLTNKTASHCLHHPSVKQVVLVCLVLLALPFACNSYVGRNLEDYHMQTRDRGETQKLWRG